MGVNATHHMAKIAIHVLLNKAFSMLFCVVSCRSLRLAIDCGSGHQLYCGSTKSTHAHIRRTTFIGRREVGKSIGGTIKVGI